MRRGLAAAGVVALITSGAAACGNGEPTTPQGKIDKAFSKLGEQKSLTLGLAFTGTDQQIYNALKDGGDFTLADAKIMAGLHITAAYSSDKTLAQLLTSTSGKADKSASAALEVTSGDGKDAKHLIGVRSVADTVYVQADIKGITSLSPDTSGLSDMNDMLSGVDELPDSFASVKALVHGDWISIDPKSFMDFAKTMGGDGSDSGDDSGLGLPKDLPSAVPSDLAGKTFGQLIAPLQKSISKDATLTDLGTKNGADHIKASIPAKKLAKDLQDAVNSLGSLSKSLPGDFSKSLDDIPNKDVSLDIALKNGELSSITVDLAQLDKTTHGTFPLTLSVEGGAAQIDAPKGAKQLNPQDLMGLFMQQFGQDDSFGDGSGM